jgi:uncharacterized membrane protein YedE/YeeE
MNLTGLLSGIALGFVIQRGRFCTASLVRETVLKRPVALYSIGIIILIQTVGVHAFAAMGLISLADIPFQPVSAAAGGLLFGVGLIVAGFCPATLWVRSGEGIITAWAGLGAFMLGVEAAKSGPLKQLYQALRDHETAQTYAYESLSIASWWLVGVLALACILWVLYALLHPAPKPFVMMPQYSGIRHWLFEAHWHPAITAALIGVIALLAWPLADLSGRSSGVAFSGPSGNLLALMVYGKPAIHWGMLFIIGVMLGGAVAAKGSGEFRWRVGNANVLLRAISGGLAMGAGSAIASGCIIGHCIINASLFLWQGIIAGISILIGATVTVWLLYNIPLFKKDS